MTPDEIRAEAIERVARYSAELEGIDAERWPLIPAEARALYRKQAGWVVDALGDLLPTRIEKRLLDDGSAGFAITEDGRCEWFATAGTQQRRYVTEWRSADD